MNRHHRHQFRSSYLWLTLAVFCQFGGSTHTFALDPTKSIYQYNCDSWNPQNGLPASYITTVAQTQDGHIWLGTQNGLVQFDGLNFKTVPIDLPPGQAPDVQNLLSRPDGRLLIAIKGSIFRNYDGQQFNSLPGLGTLPQGDLCDIFQSTDGTVLLSVGIGMQQIRPGKAMETLPGAGDMTFVTSFAQDPAGQIWFGTIEKGLFHIADGKCIPFPVKSLTKENISALAIDHENRIWVGTQNGLHCYTADGTPVRVPNFSNEVRALLVDQHDTLWIGSVGMGLGRYQNGAFTFLGKSDGLASDNITSLTEDREGSLWVGTRDGLSQLTDLKFPIYSGREGIINGSAHSVAASKRGGVWVATTSGFGYFDGKTVENYTQSSLLINPYIKLVFEARNGTIYTIDAEKNVNVISGGRLLARYPNEGWPTAFAEDDQSVVVAEASPVGLVRIKDGQLLPYQYLDKNLPQFYWINSLFSSRDNAIWVASNNGFFRVKDGKFQQWSIPDGLIGNKVYYITEDSDGTIWVGLSTGIARLKNGHVKSITHNDGLYDERIYALIPDDYGYFWASSGHGIERLSKKNLNDFADGKVQQIECKVFNGLESIKTSDRNEQENSGCKTLDGRIWFPSPFGVVMINPTNYFSNPIPPPVSIDAVLVNNKEVPNRTDLELTSGSSLVEIHFSALSLIAPKKVKIRYQLEGMDQSWMDAVDRHSAVYSNLKPGHYTFHVQACNADGAWNNTGASLHMVWPAPFYQTPLFVILTGLGTVLTVFGLYRWKLHSLELRQRKLQAEKNLLKIEVENQTRELAGSNEALRKEIAERTRTEQQIKDVLKEQSYSLSLLNATLESTPDGIGVFDLTGKGVSSNRKLAQMWGTPENLQKGANRTELVNWAAQQTVNPEEFIKQIKLREQNIREEAFDTVTLKDGRMFERYVRPQLIGSECIGQVVIYRDITERKKAEAELAFERDLLRTLLDNSVDHIYFKDKQSRFILCSDPQARQFGLSSPVEVVGKTDFDFFSEEHARPAFEDEQEIIRTGKPMVGKIEKESWNDHRQESWVLTTKMPLRNKAGEIVGTFGISKDITPIKEAEAKLEEAHKQLIETSRQAGMAEVATSVLHNIGNVLNSVNVSATLVADNAKKSKIPYLGKTSALLNQHAADLGSFMTQDAKGRQVPGYLTQLASQLAEEQQTAITELELLRKNIEHIKDIVAMQQSYAKISGITESVKVADLVEDALRMNASALVRHEVEIVRDFCELPSVILEKHKVLQILVNLIRNAKYACDDSGHKNKQLKIQLTKTAERVRIAIIDNGVGIPLENLTRIFNHGFTTRTGGHGFGLHSGALAAKELGGSLIGQSEGPGKGAEFILELPLLPPKADT